MVDARNTAAVTNRPAV